MEVHEAAILIPVNGVGVACLQGRTYGAVLMSLSMGLANVSQPSL